MKTELVQSLCEIAGHTTYDRFVDIGKMVPLPKSDPPLTNYPRGCHAN